MADPKTNSLPILLGVFLFSFIFGTMTFFSLLVQLVRKGPRRLFYVKQRNVRPAALSSNEFGSHEFVMLKNSRMKLHCVVNGSKDKPLMLFLHGFPELWYSWRYQLKEFCKDYRVVAIDMRGYGESDKPTSVSDYHIDKLTSDVNQLIGALGYEKCILVGHDWGGAVAWSFVSQYPDMVDKLIVCNVPHPRAFAKHVRSSLTQFLCSWYIFFFQVPVLPILYTQADDLRIFGAAFCDKMGKTSKGLTDDDIEVYKYTFAEYRDLLGPINYYRAALRYKASKSSKAKITCPVLMVWGTKDIYLTKQLPELSAKYVENYTLKWVEGASHWVQQEEPEQVNELMREFLRD